MRTIATIDETLNLIEANQLHDPGCGGVAKAAACAGCFLVMLTGLAAPRGFSKAKHRQAKRRRRISLERRPSVEPYGRIEVPGATDLDHVDVAGQRGRERLVVLVTLHDAPYRFVDFRHATR